MSTLRSLSFSDLYLEKEVSASRIRAEGGLTPVPKEVWPALQSLLKNIDSHARSAADSSHFSVPFEDLIYRVQAIDDVRGRVYALRRSAEVVPQLSSCGIMAPIVDHLMTRSAGLVLFAGGFGTGKTTAASAFVRAKTMQGALSVTLEDPPELPLSGDHGAGRCLQVAVNRRNVEAAVEDTLRMAFDVLFISEIRTPAMAAEVVKASVNGKMIVSTLHADNACTAVSRLISLASDGGSGFGERAARETLAAGLTGVVYMSRIEGNRRVATEYLLGGRETQGKIAAGEYTGLQNVVNSLRNRLNLNMPLMD